MSLLSHHEVQSLRDRCEDVFLEYSYCFFKNYEETQDEIAVRKYVKYIETNITNEFIEKLMNNLLDEFCNEKNSLAGLNVLQVLTNPETKVLRLNNLCESITLSILETIHENCSIRLEHLELINNQSNKESNCLEIMRRKKKIKVIMLDKIIPTFTNLSVLHIHVLIDEVVFKKILDMLPKLKVFISTTNRLIDKTFIKSWGVYPTLNELDLGIGTYSTPDVIAIFLQIFTNLKIIGTSYIGEAIKQLLNEKSDVYNPNIDLSSIVKIETSYAKPTEMRALTKMCPNVEKLICKFPLEFIMPLISGFKNITQLSIHNIKESEFDLFLGEFSKQLTLIDIRHSQSIDIGNILNNCPKLTELQLNLVDEIIVSRFEIIKPCPMLKKFVARVTPNCFKSAHTVQILKSLVAIEHLEVFFFFNITDRLLDEFISSGKGKHLKYVEFTYSSLTIISLMLLLNNCPLLEHIHGVSTWTINFEELDNLSRLKRCCKIKPFPSHDDRKTERTDSIFGYRRLKPFVCQSNLINQLW